ncbi:PREDICTED: rRNA methyltransferase 1, mitochondrial [Gekko japonicus]|uniref:rRNA methyltransferase 1, mitochondrial n=1 Tax=Gekko japonicus TaxID=146911 RepID=A0ABM1JU41_GEKJA|nr:PREDICTED: rRNA methyltransferase 1, mitochondrial [Gekko japonicus]XP_015264977.1 PREDICTED: rRNA methyltransferase 1, mitochondrial [Gekko japonicus]XP_015264978.1 PREDICTED: rRNA methyltransferase 1, mitochondrial [Gekko japonicus]
MECLPSFKFCFRNAVRLGLAVRRNHPPQTFRHFSVWEERLLLENGSPRRAGPKEVSRRHVDSLLDRAESGGAAQPNQQPLPTSKPCQDHRLQTPSHLRWKLPAKCPPAREEEFWNLRNDDFREKGQSQPRPLPAGRTKGSEVLFGIAPCSLALARAKRGFFRLFLKSGSTSTRPVMEDFSQRAEARGIPVKLVPRKVLDALCQGGVHQGVCLEATPLRPISWQEGSSHEAEGATSEGAQLLWLALEGIQDPMNLGAVLRSAHFLGVDGIVMSQRNSCPLTPVVSKASAGAMEVLDVFGTDHLQSFLQAKSEQGWEIIGTVGHSTAVDDIPTESCLDFRWTKPTILLLGNEGYGLSPETRRLCRRMLSIFPGRELQPGIESLNVSVAAGILLHSICSQKMKAT